MNRAETGHRGEAAAARWYQKQGCRLLAHNFHTRMGELDVVVQEPDGTIVICEVKTRSSDADSRPAAARISRFCLAALTAAAGRETAS